MGDKGQNHLLSQVTTLTGLQTQLNKANKSVLFFWATWVGPSLQIKPYFQKQCSQNGINCIEIDANQADDLNAKYKITIMPTITVVDKTGAVKLTRLGGSQGNVNDAIANTKL